MRTRPVVRGDRPVLLRDPAACVAVETLLVFQTARKKTSIDAMPVFFFGWTGSLRGGRLSKRVFRNG